MDQSQDATANTDTSLEESFLTNTEADTGSSIIPLLEIHKYIHEPSITKLLTLAKQHDEALNSLTRLTPQHLTVVQNITRPIFSFAEKMATKLIERTQKVDCLKIALSSPNLNEAKSYAETLKREIGTLQVKIEDLSTKINEQDAIISNLNNQNGILKQKMGESRDNLSSQQKITCVQDAEIKSLKSQIANYELELKVNEKSNDKLCLTFAKINEELNSKIAQLSTQNNDTEVSALKSKLEDQAECLCYRDKQIAALQKEINEIKTKAGAKTTKPNTLTAKKTTAPKAKLVQLNSGTTPPQPGPSEPSNNSTDSSVRTVDEWPPKSKPQKSGSYAAAIQARATSTPIKTPPPKPAKEPREQTKTTKLVITSNRTTNTQEIKDLLYQTLKKSVQELKILKFIEKPGTLGILFGTPEAANHLKQLIEGNRTLHSSLCVKSVTMVNPMVIFYNVDKKATPEQLTSALNKAKVPSSNIRFVRRINHANKNHWVVEAPPATYQALKKLNSNLTLRIGRTDSRYAEYINVKQCTKCWMYGHLVGACKISTTHCGNCCEKRHSGHCEPSCFNCMAFNRIYKYSVGTNHAIRDKTNCQAYINRTRQYRNTVNYF